MGLRTRVAVVLAVACAVVASVVGAVGYRSAEQRLVAEVDQSLEQVAVLLTAGRVQNRVPARVLGDVYSARQFDERGEITRSNFVVEIPAGDDLDDAIGFAGSRSFSSVTALDGSRHRVLTIGGEQGAVQIARPLDETDNVVADLRARTLRLAITTALGGALVGWIVADRIAAPLRRLTSAAERVEESGRLDVDLGPDGGRDEVGRLRRSFGAMLGALDRSRSEQRRLVQDAGHELRTPLTSLRTNLAVLRRHDDLPAETRAEIVADLTGEVDELADLVDELVAAAHGEHQDEPSSEIDVGALARTVADRVARRRGRPIDVAVADDAPMLVVAGPLGLARAMTNLIENACKFDTTGTSIDVQVRSLATPAGRVVAFRVADRGPGVPDADLDRLFDRFFRVEATRTLPGSGLGLAIVRDVVTRAGGDVVARNRAGGGSEIGFDLPAS